MRLFWSSRSPFVRKVMVFAHEKGVADRLEPERVVVGAASPNERVMRDNPLNKIPTLVLPDGTAFYDSRVICEFLDGLGDGPALVPTGPARWTAMRLQALGDGLMELNVARIGENNRPEAIRSDPHQVAFRAKTAATLDRLEGDAALLSGAAFHVGAIAVAVAFSHLDFRFAADAWRGTRPGLAAWHERVRQRPSMQQTEFRDEY